MTIAEILVTAYLLVGAMASALIWAILTASKRRESKAKNMNVGRLEYNLFRETNTKTSRFQS